MTNARGKYAFGFCDRTGFRYPLDQLVDEYQNGAKTGLKVGFDVVDPDHPQNFLGRVRVDDSQSLREPRPDTNLDESRVIQYGFAPVGFPTRDFLPQSTLEAVTSIGTVTVVIS